MSLPRKGREQAAMMGQYSALIKLIFNLVVSFSWLGCQLVTLEIRGSESRHHRTFFVFPYLVKQGGGVGWKRCLL